MTRHTVTVEKTVESDETVYTCDYCGLGDEAGEMLEYTFEGSDAFKDDECFRSSFVDLGDFDVDAFHFHISCVPQVATNEDVAELTLASQYNRRTGDKLLLVITRASLVFYGVSAGLLWAGWQYGGWGSAAAYVLGAGFLLLSLAASHREAQATLKEFST